MFNLRNITLLGIILVACLFSLAQEQEKGIKYDDWPVTRETNVREPGRYVPLGTTWDHNILTFFIVNGTPDINGDLENGAIFDAMALWEAATNIRFLEVDNEADADFILAWHAGNHGDGGPFDGANGVLAHQLGGPPPNSFGNTAGDIHFDESETWTLALRNNSAQPIDLISVAAHELGHALGLDHTTVSGSLMAASYTSSHRFLGNDDRNGVRSLYGSPQEDAFITGNKDVCSSRTYSLSHVPAAAGVTWTTSSNLSISGSSTGNSVNVTNPNPSATGTVGWVRATLTTGAGNLVLQRDLNVGVPGRPGYITGPSHDLCEYTGDSYRYYVPATPGATSYRWTWSGGYPLTIITTNPEIYIDARDLSEGTYALTVKAQNSCGIGPRRAAAIYVLDSNSPECGGCTGRLCFINFSHMQNEDLLYVEAEAGHHQTKKAEGFLVYIYKGDELVFQQEGFIGGNYLEIDGLSNGEYQVQLIHSQGVVKKEFTVSR